jgi:hypothetical protein
MRHYRELHARIREGFENLSVQHSDHPIGMNGNSDGA